MLSSTLLPINTCFYFLFRAAICVTVSILPHLTQGPGCAESLIFPSSTLSPQPNTVLYQKVAKPPCLVVIAALTSFLPTLPSSAWSLVLGGGGGGLKGERSRFSLESMWHLGADQYPQTSKGSRQKSLDCVGVCLLKEYPHLQFWNWKDEYDHCENITQCLEAKVFVALSNRAVSQGT